MTRRENNFPLVAAAAGLTVGILVTFQIYQWREPARLAADTLSDEEAAVAAGEDLYTANCTGCHGQRGEGGIGPALNSKELMESVSDAQFFSLIRTGVPGTGMPAWGQVFGGPLTDEEVRQVVAFLGSLEPAAAEAFASERAPDPARGAEVFESVCFACHGSQGRGTDRAPAINDPERLKAFPDDWYRETIIQGRPSRGMPTWGTVLSPAVIDDLVALIGAWRRGETVPLPGASATRSAEPDGMALYAAQCSACHGEEGEGGIGPQLRPNDFVAEQSDESLTAFLLEGRSGTAMAGFEGRLAEAELEALVGVLREWQR